MLYAKWAIIPNPNHKKLWEKYQSLANEIVKSNKSAMATSILFYLDVRKKFLFNNFFPEYYEECVRRGYSSKALSQIIRYHLLLELLNSDEEYEISMSDTLNEKTLFAKNGNMSKDNVYWLMLTLPNQMLELKKEIEQNYPVDIQKCQQIETQLINLQNQVLGEII